MEILKYIYSGILVVFALIIFLFAIHTKKAFKMLVLNCFIGLGIFAVLYFTRKYTGIKIYLNGYTAVGSAVFGVPAVIGFLMLNFIF